MPQNAPALGDDEDGEALPRVGDVPLEQLVAAPGSALANVIERVLTEERNYAAFGNAP